MTHSWFVFVILALATYRLTRLIVDDEITHPVRVFLLAHARPLFNLATCAWCVSIWVAAGVVALAHFEMSWFQYIVFALALSSISGLIAERV